MKLGKKIFLVSSFFGFVSLFSLNVLGQTQYRNALQPLWDLISYVFGLATGSNQYVFFRFILWILLATILMALVPKALEFLKSQDETTKKNAKIVAWILSLMMSVAIPTPLLDLIFGTYSLLGVFLLIIVAPAMIFSTIDKKNQKLRAVAFFGAGLLLIVFANVAVSGKWINPNLKNNLLLIIDWINIAGIIMMVIGIWMLLTRNRDNTTENTSSQETNNANDYFETREEKKRKENNRKLLAELKKLEAVLSAFESTLKNFDAIIEDSVRHINTIIDILGKILSNNYDTEELKKLKNAIEKESRVLAKEDDDLSKGINFLRTRTYWMVNNFKNIYNSVRQIQKYKIDDLEVIKTLMTEWIAYIKESEDLLKKINSNEKGNYKLVNILERLDATEKKDLVYSEKEVIEYYKKFYISLQNSYSVERNIASEIKILIAKLEQI